MRIQRGNGIGQGTLAEKGIMVAAGGRPGMVQVRPVKTG